MSRLGSLYITSGEPDGPLCGGCCEVDDWAAAEIERLRAALLDTARRVEALKRECGTDPESAQAIRNSEYMSISLNARAALLPDNA